MCLYQAADLGPILTNERIVKMLVGHAEYVSDSEESSPIVDRLSPTEPKGTVKYGGHGGQTWIDPRRENRVRATRIVTPEAQAFPNDTTATGIPLDGGPRIHAREQRTVLILRLNDRRLRSIKTC